MPETTRSGGMCWQLWVYTSLSLVLSTAPVWIRDIIVARYDPISLQYGSFGDALGWFWYTMLAALVDALIQFVFLFLRELAPLATRLTLILSSILLWIASIAWTVHTGFL